MEGQKERDYQEEAEGHPKEREEGCSSRKERKGHGSREDWYDRWEGRQGQGGKGQTEERTVEDQETRKWAREKHSGKDFGVLKKLEENFLTFEIYSFLWAEKIEVILTF